MLGAAFFLQEKSGGKSYRIIVRLARPLKGDEYIDECDMAKFGALDSSNKTNAILGDTGRWWPRTAKQEGDKMCKKFPVSYTHLTLPTICSV